MTYVNETYKNPVPPTLATLLDAVKREIKKDINAVRIGIIQSFDAALQEVTVKIAQQQVTSIKPDGTRTIAEYPLLLKVPVQFPAGGGFTLTFPIAAGDECIILFNDREIDNWVTSGPGLAPTSNRVHDLSDGIAIVGIRSNPRALSGVSTASAQLRNDAGDTYVEVAGGGVVNVVATTSINLTAPSVNIVASTEFTVDSPLETHTGVVNYTDTIGSGSAFNVNGTIRATGDVIAGTISLETHVHGGVQTGSGNTGVPV